MSTKIEDTICTKCWGRGRIFANSALVPHTHQPGVVCPRCKGTGEEPDTFNLTAVILCIIIFVVGLYLVWSIPH